ncbi:hypothetical protein E2C01_029356 [Portunus trituberculatus]|uniref:Uncharacterized protein n=1 Tax=Portunus trituberculatus TaxID=210409 RepID=A0A5B7ERM2_PORTR|nr:hypothetical protein [Portunus trituberculatus]
MSPVMLEQVPVYESIVPGQRIGGGGPPNPDSDSEDPLYSTVKPKNRVKGNNQQMVNSETEKNEMVNKSKKAGKNASKCSVEGIDNHGFVESPTLFSDPPQGTQTTIPQISLKAPLPKLSENAHGLEMARQGHDSFLMGNNSSTTDTDVWGSSSGVCWEEASGGSEQGLGRKFCCHHPAFDLFVLQGLVRPVFVDSLRLIIEYLVQPFITGVLKPLLVTVHAASLHLILTQHTITTAATSATTTITHLAFPAVKCGFGNFFSQLEFDFGGLEGRDGLHGPRVILTHREFHGGLAAGAKLSQHDSNTCPGQERLCYFKD